jgi:hypothetical protein
MFLNLNHFINIFLNQVNIISITGKSFSDYIQFQTTIFLTKDGGFYSPRNNMSCKCQRLIGKQQKILLTGNKNDFKNYFCGDSFETQMILYNLI